MCGQDAGVCAGAVCAIHRADADGGGAGCEHCAGSTDQCEQHGGGTSVEAGDGWRQRDVLGCGCGREWTAVVESDLEGVYEVTSVSVRFAGTGSYAYEIQSSTDDRMTWKTVAKGTAEAAGAPVAIALPAGTRTSGVRVVLDSVL